MKMRFCAALVIVCAVAYSTAVAKCTPAEEKQIADVRDSWVKDWNAKQLDNVIKLYATDATYLPSDGSRVNGQDAIKTYFAKLMGSKVSVASVTLDCSGEFAYDSGTYTQDLAGGMTIAGNYTIQGNVAISGGGKHVEGNYLVVLKREGGKWLIVEHASTAKP